MSRPSALARSWRSTHRATLLAAALLIVAASGAAQTPAPSATLPADALLDPGSAEASAVLERALLLLSGYHGLPDISTFEAAFDDPRAVMLAIASDESASPIHRDRALAALAWWPNPEVEALYLELLQAPETREMVRHRLIGHLAVAFGDNALAHVSPYLEHNDIQLRLTAIQALWEIGTPMAFEQLERAAQRELSPMVLERLRSISTLR